MLVFYNRPDSAGAKLSEYQCVSVIHPDELKVSLRVFVVDRNPAHVTYTLLLLLLLLLPFCGSLESGFYFTVSDIKNLIHRGTACYRCCFFSKKLIVTDFSLL